MTTTEVSRELRVDPATVRKWILSGQLPAIRLPGGQKRIKRSDVDALVGK